jgi:hypothetical protein
MNRNERAWGLAPEPKKQLPPAKWWQIALLLAGYLFVGALCSGVVGVVFLMLMSGAK